MSYGRSDIRGRRVFKILRRGGQGRVLYPIVIYTGRRLRLCWVVSLTLLLKSALRERGLLLRLLRGIWICDGGICRRRIGLACERLTLSLSRTRNLRWHLLSGIWI